MWTATIDFTKAWWMRSSWTNRGKCCRGNCGRPKDTPMCCRRFKATSTRICNSSCRKLSRGGMIFCRSTRESRRGLSRHRASRIRRETCKKETAAGEAGSSRPRERDKTNAAATAVEVLAGEARPPEIAEHSASTASVLAVSCDEAGSARPGHDHCRRYSTFRHSNYKGVEGSEWEEVYFHYREMSKAAGAQKPSGSHKS